MATFTLTGTLYHQDTVTPVAGTRIKVWSPNIPDTFANRMYAEGIAFTTDANGHFSVTLATPMAGVYYRIKSLAKHPLFQTITFAAPAGGSTVDISTLTVYDPSNVQPNWVTTVTNASAAAQAAVATVAYSTWQATTAYVTNQTVQAPDGSLIKRIANGTSRATFDTTEQAAWTVVSATANTLEQVALANALGRGVSVMDPRYGAKGDGVTDDTAAIHAARDAAAVSGSDVVFPPGRTYLVGNLTANVAGQLWSGYGATIKAKAGLGTSTNVLRVTAADVTVRGLTFDLSNIANTFPAANLDYPLVSVADGTTWESCYVKSSPGYGIASTGGVSRQKVRNCRFLNTAYGAVTLFNLAGGPVDAYDFLVVNNYIDGSSMGVGSRTSGIGCQAGTGQRMHRFVCTGNTVLLPSAQTFGAAGIVGAINCTDFTISNNVGVGSNIAYSISGGDFGTVSSNVARGFSQYGLEVAGTSDHVTVADNTVDGGNLGFRGLSASATTTGLSMSGNIIRNLATAGESAIYIGPATNPSITSNFVYNTNNLTNWTAVNFTQAISSGTVSGNTFDGGASATNCQGVQFLSSVTGCAVTGNAFNNFPSRAAVRLGAGSGTVDFITLSGNSLKNCANLYQNATFGTAVVGTNNQIPRFDPVVTGSAASQAATFATDTYVTGTGLSLPTTLTSRTMYRVRFNVSKTAAGVAAPVLTMRVGTAGSVADTAIATLTFSAQTAVADTGVIEVFANFRAAGASATLAVTASMIHSGGTTGLNVLNSEVKFANTSTFNSTTQSQILGLSLNAGASAAWNVDVVQSELFGLPQV